MHLRALRPHRARVSGIQFSQQFSLETRTMPSLVCTSFTLSP